MSELNKVGKLITQSLSSLELRLLYLVLKLIFIIYLNIN